MTHQIEEHPNAETADAKEFNVEYKVVMGLNT